MDISRKKLALIHIIKKELNLSEPEYRGILKQVAGVASATELSEEKFRKLMNYFVRSKYYRVNAYGLTMRQKLYIKYLAKHMGWEDRHLSNFLHKYYHKYELERLTRQEAIRAIESLKNVREHSQGQGLPEDKSAFAANAKGE